MTSNPDLEKWQKAIQGIEAGQKDLSPEELSAFQALKELADSDSFESSQSGGNISVIKNALSNHSKHRLLKAHLTNFVAICEKSFTNKSASIAQHQVSTFAPPQEPIFNHSQESVFAQEQEPTFVPPQTQTVTPPEMPLQQFVPPQPTFEDLTNENDIAEQNELVQDTEVEKNDLPQVGLYMSEQQQTEVPPPTFGSVQSKDIAELQKSIQGIEVEQKNLSSVEWSAFEILRENCFKGNFELNGSEALIKELKVALPSHSKHRLLQKVHLPNFIKLCEMYFKDEVKAPAAAYIASQNIIIQDNEPIFKPPIIQEEVSQQETKFPEEDQNEPFIHLQNKDTQEDSPTFQPPTFQPPTFQPPVDQETIGQREKKTTEPKQKKESAKSKVGNNSTLILVVAIVAIIGIWLVYQNWSTVSEKLGFVSDIIAIDDPKDVIADEDNKDQLQQPDVSTSVPFGEDSQNNDKVQSQQPDATIDQSVSSGNEASKTNEKTQTQESNVAAGSSVSSGTISVNGGSYNGELKNKQPHGMGTIRYNSRTLIDSRDTKKRYAEAGQSLTGQFRDGRLLQGKLFDSNGNQIETIIIGGGVY